MIPQQTVLERCIKDAAALLWDEPIEHEIIFDQQGRYITMYHGDATSVCRDGPYRHGPLAIAIHNHPGDSQPYCYLSWDDILSHIDCGEGATVAINDGKAFAVVTGQTDHPEPLQFTKGAPARDTAVIAIGLEPGYGHIEGEEIVWDLLPFPYKDPTRHTVGRSG